MSKMKALKGVSILCAVVLMTVILPITASAKILEEEIDMQINESDFISFNEETYNWNERFNESGPLKGKMNCVKEGAKISFSLKPNSKAVGDVVLTATVYKLSEDGKTVDDVSDLIFQRGLTETPMIIDFASSDDYDSVSFSTGNENGVSRKDFLYFISISDFGDMGNGNDSILYVYRIGDGTSSNHNKSPQLEIKPSATKVMVNNKDMTVNAYKFDNNNYFSLRNFAILVNGTDKQFEVSFNADKNAINLTSGKPYTKIGGELAVDSNTKANNITKADIKILVDGNEFTLTAQNIDGNNYFKLRDMAKILNINVTYDSSTGSLSLDTSSDYTEQ